MNLDTVLSHLANAEAAHAGLNGGATADALESALAALLDEASKHRAALRGTEQKNAARLLLAKLEDAYEVVHVLHTSDSPTAPSPHTVYEPSPSMFSDEQIGQDVILRTGDLKGRVGTIVRRFIRNVRGRNETALIVKLSETQKIIVNPREVEVLS